ncbi:MAG: hypothetical protein R3Y28_01520 [Candidatus Gastranaerophilales bacterium]
MKFTSKHIIKAILSDEKVRYEDIAYKLQEKTGRQYNKYSFCQRLNRGTFMYDEVADICEILGYDVKIEKKK